MDLGPLQLTMTLTDEEAFATPPPRRTLCPAYELCLTCAADHLWTSFTCRGCFIEKLILLGIVKELPPTKLNEMQIAEIEETANAVIEYY